MCVLMGVLQLSAFRRWRSAAWLLLCVCVCGGGGGGGGWGGGGGHVYVVYEDTNLYNDMGMT